MGRRRPPPMTTGAAAAGASAPAPTSRLHLELHRVVVVERVRRRAERSQKIGMPQEMGRAPERLEGVGDRRARERVLVEKTAREEDALLAPPLRRVRPRQHAARLRHHLQQRAADVLVACRPVALPRELPERRRRQGRRQAQVDAARAPVDVLDQRVDLGRVASGCQC